MKIMKRWISLLFLMVALLGINFSAVKGESYHFKMPTVMVNFYINADGSASIEYTYDFINDAGAPNIEFVDLGMPINSSYDYNQMSGEIDGVAITHIQSSEMISNGVEFGLGANSIPPGGTGRFHALISKVENVIYPGTAEENEPYASIQFQPNYYESGTVSGKTDMTVTIYLPTGLKPDEPRYYQPEGWPGVNEPESGFDEQGRVYYRWHSTDASGESRYVFGASFPARLVPAESIIPPPSTGSGSTGGFFDNISGNCLGFGICGFVLLTLGSSIYQGTIGASKRKMKYLPPKISIEGHGIKRGLTAVEAAVLLEQPMDKLLTMILFSSVKKGAATVTTRDPLKLEVSDPLPEDLRAYETDFLEAFKIENNALRRNALQELMVKLVKSVTQKMKGFSYKETLEYYKSIIERAWEHISEADTPEIKMQNLDDAMDWTMLDRDYEERSRRVFTGPVFVPMWWGRYDPTFHPAPAMSGGTSAAGPRPSGGSVSLPHLPGSDFAASVVNGVQGFSAGVIGNLRNFTSGVTNKTNPMPKTSGRYTGGGGGCACACACAGCACACAGGGR